MLCVALTKKLLWLVAMCIHSVIMEINEMKHHKFWLQIITVPSGAIKSSKLDCILNFFLFSVLSFSYRLSALTISMLSESIIWFLREHKSRSYSFSEQYDDVVNIFVLRIRRTRRIEFKELFVVASSCRVFCCLRENVIQTTYFFPYPSALHRCLLITFFSQLWEYA